MAMSDADRARARAVRTLNTTKSANSISNRDARQAQLILEEVHIARALREARQDFLSGEMGTEMPNSTKSANSISNRDVQMSQEDYMKRNDGGMAMSGRGKPVRTF